MQDKAKAEQIRRRMEELADGLEGQIRELEGEMMEALGTPSLIELPGDVKMIALDDKPVLVGLMKQEGLNSAWEVAAFSVEVLGVEGSISEPFVLGMN